MIYVSPTFQSPTGTVMGALQRRRLAELAEEHQTTVVEDLGPAWLNIDDVVTPAPVAALAPDRTVSLGSMSKAFWAGLRVGWVGRPLHWPACPPPGHR